MSRKFVLAISLTFVLVGMLSIAVRVQRVEASETIYIRATGEVEGTSKIQRNGSIYLFTDNINDSVMVERSDIVLDGKGYLLEGNGTGTGVDIAGRNNVTVKNLKIRSFKVGVYLRDSSNISVCRNEMIENNAGIALFSSTCNNISGNEITDFSLAIGLTEYSTQNVITKNDIIGGHTGIRISHSSNNNSIVGNKIQKNMLVGIDLGYVKFCRLEKNNVTYNEDGVFCSGSSNNILERNDIIGNKYSGIHISGQARDNFFVGNNLMENSDGFNILASISNKFSGNNIVKNSVGIRIFESINNQFSGNSIVRNRQYGIWLYSSPNNILYHNNIVNNTRQIFDYSENNTAVLSSNNQWDNEEEGNYWDNFSGVDWDRDGISNTMHTIDTNNVDRYPLMGSLSDFNATSDQRVHTICNSTISGFQYNGTAISFKVSGKDDTSGFCRICIPTALMNDTLTVFTDGKRISHISIAELSNSTHNYIYFTYALSTTEVVIMAEFPSIFTPPLFIIATVLTIFIIATLLTVIIYRRKLKS